MFREAGARDGYNAFLSDINVGVPAADERRIEVLAQDIPGGVQLAADITLRSVLTWGSPILQAADVDGAVLMPARREKETTYPKLAASGRCKLVVVGTTGRRWNESS